MSPAYENLLDHMETHELRYQADAEREAVTAMFGGDSGAYMVVAHIDEDGDLFQINGMPAVCVPKGARHDIAEAVARANWGLKVGKFELDVDRGILHFHASNVIDGEAISDLLIGRLFATTLAMLDRYVPAFMSVIYANDPPDDAVRNAEAA